MQAGDFATRVEVDTRDEFGELAAGFNDMAQTLQSLYGGLEDKVREKTLRLELKRRRLADLYEVSAFVAEAPTLDALAQGFARHVRRIAEADAAAAVRWCDDTHQRYLMLAHDRLPQELALAEACLETATSPAAAAAAARVPHPGGSDQGLGHRRAGFASVVSVPVRLHEKVLAEVNLFFRQPMELGEEDRELLDALASHLASAMESLRASAMEREAAVAQERSFIARELHDSIAVARLHEDPGAVAAPGRAAGRHGRRAAHRGGTRRGRARELCRRARAADALPHAHQRGHRARAARHAAEVRAPGRAVHAPHHGRPRRPAGRGRAGAGAASCRKRCPTCASTPARAMRELHVQPSPHWRFEVSTTAGFDPADPARAETHVGLRIMQERAQRMGAHVRCGPPRGRLHRGPGTATRGAGRPRAAACRDDGLMENNTMSPARCWWSTTTPCSAEAWSRCSAPTRPCGWSEKRRMRPRPVRKARELQPDLVLLDNHLPGATGIQALGDLKEAAPAAKFVLLTVSEDEGDLHLALRNGANGYLLKTIEGDVLTAAIHRDARRAGDQPGTHGQAAGRAAGASAATPCRRRLRRAADTGPALSPREQEVLRQIAWAPATRRSPARWTLPRPR